MSDKKLTPIEPTYELGPNGYPLNWPEIATQKKDAVGWRCERCGHPHEPGGGYCLTVHHLDGIKTNCWWWNLVALCQRCHLSVQARVNMSQGYLFDHADWMTPYVEARDAAMRKGEYSTTTNWPVPEQGTYASMCGTDDVTP